MAKTWYPVIDYSICVDCGTCVAMCPHGVYDIAKLPSPVVKRPGACVNHCHGCGNRCPVGAITYIGEDTGWTPKNRAQTTKESSCGCGCAQAHEKKATVQYLYLDLQTCERCIGTDHVLDDVMLTLTPALQLAGYEVEYDKVEMETAELAEKYQFLSSPTIRVNGRDICLRVKENSCGCCGDISGTDVACRVFEYEGKSYEVPPKEMLSESILQAVFGQKPAGCSNGSYELSENLKHFYDGKKIRNANVEVIVANE